MLRYAIISIGNTALMVFNEIVPEGLVLRTDNGPQYISKYFRNRFEKKEVEETLDKNCGKVFQI